MDFASDDLPLQPHDRWMRAALQLARQAFDEDEVPIGAVIVHNDRIIGEGYNQRESLNDPTAHAEMIAITQAANSLESWRLRASTIAPAHIGQGSSVTYIVQSSSRQDSSEFAARVIAIISACAVGSLSDSRWL